MTENGASRQRLPAVVRRLGVVSFFNDLASEMVYPLLPAFVTTQLGGGAITLGALDGVADAVAAGVKLVSGWLADRRWWRRPLVIGGYGIATLARPLIGLATSGWQVIALRATDRIGKGIRNPPRDAVIADAAHRSIRGRAFGFHRAMDHAGAMIGPLVAWGLIAWQGMTPRDVILASVLPGLLAVVVVAWAMTRVEPARPGPSQPAAATPSCAPPEDVSKPSSRLFLLIVLFAFARLPETLFLLRLQDLRVPVAVIPLLWSLLHVVRTAASYPGGGLSDRLGPRATMVGGWALYCLMCLGLAGSGGAVAGSLWFLALGVVTALTESPERAFVASLSARRGTQFGMYHASVGVAALPGSLLLGVVYAVSGGPAALGVSAALAGLLAGAGFVIRDRGTDTR